ncbi:precorrin-3B synthase [Actinoplanes sp. NPDC020271]|uniref:precorrin-3B synthase n=1 Tax=Actinoplanes sp. NPDC020271 TaxID=3363896 RepID=UPI00378CF0B7
MTRLRQSDTDACPGALRLHPAADGLLARVRLPGGLLSGAQLRSLRELAEEFGDGRLELTSRANLQLRALRAEQTETLAARLRAAGLLPSSTHDSVRNIAAPPLAAAPLRRLVTELDAAIIADPGLAALPGKFLFAIGHVPLAADVAAVPGGGRFALRFGGHDTGLRVDAGRVVESLVATGHAFLAERAARVQAGGGSAWRLRELPDGPERVSRRVAAALGVVPVSVPATAVLDVVEPGDLVGVVSMRPPDALGDGVTGSDQFAAGASVPLGRLEGVQVKALEDAERLVVTPWRGIVVPDLAETAARAWIGRMDAAGLVVTASSRWSGVSACAGRPGCARSLADVRADAAAATRFAPGLPVHWVGCERACGSPAGPHVRAEATTGGYAVTRRSADGTLLSGCGADPEDAVGAGGADASAGGADAGRDDAATDDESAAGASAAGASAAGASAAGASAVGLAELVAGARRGPNGV